VLGVLDLVETDDASELTIAVTAAPHIEAQHDVAPIAQHLRRAYGIARAAVTAEAMKNDKRGPLFSFLEVVRDMDRAG